jgi:hypothetical protein
MKKTRVVVCLPGSLLAVAGLALSQAPDDALDPVRVAGDTHRVALDNKFVRVLDKRYLDEGHE